MSKYQKLWEHVAQSGEPALKLTFEQIEATAGIPIDHSFLTFKKELLQYGYRVGKISRKEQTVEFFREAPIANNETGGTKNGSHLD